MCNIATTKIVKKKIKEIENVFTKTKKYHFHIWIQNTRLMNILEFFSFYVLCLIIII